MKIAIYGHYFNEDAQQYVEHLLQALNKKNTDVYIENNFYQLIKSSIQLESNYKTFSNHTDLDNTFDLMFTVGGDGTLLRSITFLRASNIPVIGVNIGRLGFLATVKKEEINSAVETLYNGNYTIKERSLLTVKTEPIISELTDLNFALNEITISRKDTASMITVETYLDDEYLTSYWADRIELYTEEFATEYEMGNMEAIKPYVDSAIMAHDLGMGINAGHDLSLKNIQYFAQNIPNLDEVSIGHALISESLYLGLENVVNMYLHKLGQ